MLNTNRTRCQLARHGVAFSNTLAILIRNQRENWPLNLITGSVVPMLIVCAVVVFGETRSEDKLMRLLAGNMVLSLLFGPLLKTAVSVSYLCERQVIEYFATLPIRKMDFIMAVTANCLCQTLPGMLLLLLLCRTLLGIRFALHPMLGVTALLAAALMATAGAVIGVVGRDFARTRLMAESCVAVLLLLSPILIPLDRFPAPLRIIGNLLPSTFAVRALQDALLGQISGATMANIGIVAAFTAGFLFAADRMLDWHIE
jgi:ABC-2 type transport system permease protein